jgi:hypothetical protein
MSRLQQKSGTRHPWSRFAQAPLWAPAPPRAEKNPRGYELNPLRGCGEPSARRLAVGEAPVGGRMAGVACRVWHVAFRGPAGTGMSDHVPFSAETPRRDIFLTPGPSPSLHAGGWAPTGGAGWRWELAFQAVGLATDCKAVEIVERVGEMGRSCCGRDSPPVREREREREAMATSGLSLCPSSLCLSHTGLTAVQREANPAGPGNVVFSVARAGGLPLWVCQRGGAGDCPQAVRATPLANTSSAVFRVRTWGAWATYACRSRKPPM